MVIQAIFLLDTLDKDINSFSMRVRYFIMLNLQVSCEIYFFESWNLYALGLVYCSFDE